MHRRLIPPIMAILFGLAALSPLVTDWPGDAATNTWTLFALTGMFIFKAVLFGWMRIRLVDQVRILSRFGAALADFFGAVVFCDVAIAAVFAIAYTYARIGRTAPFWMRLSDRAALIAGVAFVISAGGAVGIEMRLAGSKLRVHVEHDDGPVYASLVTNEGS